MSEEHDPTTDEQPAMPAWVPRSTESASPEQSEPGATSDADDPAEAPDQPVSPDPGAAATTESPVPPPAAAPVDDSATRSFPPLGRVNPHPASRVEP
ncbi:MAG: hypothetical protein AAFO29_24750, partial [Actinomycetota bacterium]